MNATLDLAPAPDATEDRQGPRPGETVMFGGAEATVIKVRPTGLLDLVTYAGGKPTAHDRVPHDVESGWYHADEAPPPLPTLDELLDRAEAEGRRVPRPGMVVLWISDVDETGPFGPWTTLKAFRARVVRPTSPTTADLEVFENLEPPLDPDDADPIAGSVVGARHTTAPVPSRFAYIEDNLALPPRGRREDVLPRRRCERPGCGRGADPGRDFSPAGSATVHLCDSCYEAVDSLTASFLAGRPA